MLRRLALVGLVGMTVALLDPLEGSVLAAGALLLVTVVANRAQLSERRWLDAALAAAVVGLVSLWGLSAVGGIGGTSGRSMWWALTMLPLPVGWLMGLWGGFRVHRALRPR
jgi:hypothetical protein